MTQKWIPPKADKDRVVRARNAKALRSKRRGQGLIEQEASRRADTAIEQLKLEIDAKPQGAHSASGKRQ